jgi:thiol:disulfide interchange protein DsbD
MKDQYQQALDIGRRENKLVLVTFTGYTCTNCHWMKANMFTKPELSAAMTDFVRVELYTDGLDATSVANQKLQEPYDTIEQPFYVLMKPDETVIAKFSGLTRDVPAFLAFLNTRS